MTVPEKHSLKIARQTMRMHCAGARIMGGMDHRQAVEVIERLTGKRVPTAPDCNCKGEVE